MQVNPGPVQSLDWLYEVRNGRAFANRVTQPAVAGEFSHIQLLNPVGSGKVALVRLIDIFPGGTTPVYYGHYNTALTTDGGAGTNLNNGAAAAACHMRNTTNAALLGTLFWRGDLLANVRNNPFGEWIAQLDAGEGIVVAAGTVNQVLTVSAEWVER
jgi:hypothetical protein